MITYLAAQATTGWDVALFAVWAAFLLGILFLTRL